MNNNKTISGTIPKQSSLIETGLRLAHPSVFGAIVGDALSLTRGQTDSALSLDATIDWICRAHDSCGRGGVSAAFSLKRGWLPPYPETTGYIIPTLLDYAKRKGDREDLIQRALEMADWECDIQMDSGAVMGGVFDGDFAKAAPVAFNTGQVILGWVPIYAESGEQRFADAAVRAADWLISEMSNDGAWRIPGVETETLEHAYDVRTGWSLLEVAAMTGDKKYVDAGIRNIEWTLQQETDTAWFKNNAFFSESRWTMTFTHTIAYVMEGLLGAWRHVQEPRYLAAVERTAEKLLRIFELRRFMAGDFDQKWKSRKRYSCLTGNAQIAGVWTELYAIGGDTRYLNAALKLNDTVKRSQKINAIHDGIRGGVKGSQPLWGTYSPFAYPNWAAKFLADSLMAEQDAMAALTDSVTNLDILGKDNTNKPSETND